MAASVAELGTPAIDGTTGFIDFDGLRARESLVWDLAAQAWVGRERYSLRMIDEWGYRQSASGEWTYVQGAVLLGPSTKPPDPYGYSNGGVDPNAYGFQPHHIDRIDLLYAAGLRIQEHLSMVIHRGHNAVVDGPHAQDAATVAVFAGDTSSAPASGSFFAGDTEVTYTGKTPQTFTGCGPHPAFSGLEHVYWNVPKCAVNWYSLSPGDPFLSPTPDRPGLPVIGAPMADDRHRLYVTGWQLSPATDETVGGFVPPSEETFYPLPYASGGSGHTIERWTSRWRPVGGPGISTFWAGNDGTRKLPDVTDGLFSFLDAEHIPLLDGSPVAVWPDYSGYDRHLVQANAAFRPVLHRGGAGAPQTGRAFVRFDGVNDWLKTPLGTLGIPSPYTFFFVMAQRDEGGAQQVWHEGYGEAKPLLYRYDNSGAVHLWVGGSELSYVHAGGWPMPWKCVSVVVKGAGSSIWENETVVLTGNPGNSGLGGMTIGAAFDGSLSAAIDVAKIVVYSRELLDFERISVVQQLNDQFGLY